MRQPALLALVMLAGCCSLDVISDEEMTLTAMVETEVRMGMYLKQHGKLPETFKELPVREGYVNRTDDGWGRPLIKNVDGDGFSLTSLGRDGVEGGTGEDADIVRKYRIIKGEIEDVTTWDRAAEEKSSD